MSFLQYFLVTLFISSVDTLRYNGYTGTEINKDFELPWGCTLCNERLFVNCNAFEITKDGSYGTIGWFTRERISFNSFLLLGCLDDQRIFEFFVEFIIKNEGTNQDGWDLCRVKDDQLRVSFKTPVETSIALHLPIGETCTSLSTEYKSLINVCEDEAAWILLVMLL